ncbi:cystathionine beta-synthase [Helicoverpa armigera]|uniref:cystathionine beta-synthase n=1 Tax=Helicoverpa armigera TaxID=29058 RepID=UPI003082778F
MYRKASNLVSMRRRFNKDTKTNQNTGGNPESKVYNSILELVGKTPLVKLSKVPKLYGVQCDIYAKCEYFNPSGSVKDRIGLSMFEDAKKKGAVNDNTTFVEASSGNTGIGIAFNAALSGNKCIIVTENKNAGEKVDTLNLLGAEVILTQSNKLEFEIAQKLKNDNPDTTVILSQFDNEVNPKTHYETTAVEILAALEDVDVVVMGAGSGGTMTGVAERLKNKNPDCLVVAAEPDGSVMFNTEGKAHPFLVEGIGGVTIPISLDTSVVDHYEVVTDQEAFLMARELAKKEGLLCGGSGGAAMCAAIKAIKTLKIGKGKRVVVILPDGIRNYMSKFVSDQWMEAHHFMEPPQHTMKWWNIPIGKLNLSRKYPKANKSSTIRETLEAMKTNGVNIAVVVDDLGNYVGAVSKDYIRNIATNPTKLPGEDSEDFNFDDPVSDHLNKNVYTLAVNSKKGKSTLGLLSRILDISPFVIIGTDDDKDTFTPLGVVTADDVLDFIQEQN